MKTFSVRLPISGYISAEVEAENEAEAIQQALVKSYQLDDIVDLEVHEKLVEGNVFYGRLARADAEEIS